MCAAEKIGDSTWLLRTAPKPLSCHAGINIVVFRTFSQACSSIIRPGALSRQILRVTSNIAHASRCHVSTALASQLRLSFPTAYRLRNSPRSGILHAPVHSNPFFSCICCLAFVFARRAFLPVESALQVTWARLYAFAGACHKVRGCPVGGRFLPLISSFRRAERKEEGHSLAAPRARQPWSRLRRRHRTCAT